MLTVGDIYLYVTDINKALRFWAEGLNLTVTEKETSTSAAFAVLEFTDGGPSIRLLDSAVPWPTDERPERGLCPGVSFDLITDAFDETLVAVLEHGGFQIDEIETYNEQRVVTVADPDGNAFDLLEVREA